MSRLQLIQTIKDSIKRDSSNAIPVYFTILNGGRTGFHKYEAQTLVNSVEYIIVCAFYNHRMQTETDTIVIIDNKNDILSEIKLSRLTISQLKFNITDTCDFRYIQSATISSNDDSGVHYHLKLDDGNTLEFDVFWKMLIDLDRNFHYNDSEFYFNFFKTKIVANRSLTIQEYKESYQKLIS